MDFIKPNSFFDIHFAFKGFALAGVHVLPGEVLVVLKRTGKTGTCPKCKRKRQGVEELRTRRIRDLDFRSKCTIVFPQAKINCTCGCRGIEELDFVDKNSMYTKRFEDYIALLCTKMSLKDVAELCNVGWKTAKNIDKKYLRKLKVGLEGVCPKRIGIDEVAHQKGHKYLTIVRDIDLGKVIWIGVSRKKETLDGFFAELGKEKCSMVTAAVMDMWDPYIASVKEHCPGADIVFDKFHIAKKVNEAVDSTRKKEFGKADPPERKAMKKKRFLILSRRKNLSREKQETVDDLLKINHNLSVCYLLKEHLLDIFSESDVAVAKWRLKRWLANVEESGNDAFSAVAKTLRKYWYGILNYFRHGITNAGAEGTNNKIGVIKRMAYGFRDLEYFMLKILQSCGWRSS